MEWQKLVGFYEAAICRSFTKASKRTFRSQSALSQQIQSLEKEFNCLLFERIGKRSLRLTLAGERLFSFVDNLMRRQRELIEDLHEITGHRSGRLRVAGQFASFYYQIPDIVKTYMDRYPNVNLMLFERPYHEIIPLVQSGEIDFGIFIEATLPKDLTAIRWRKADVVLVTPLNHPLTREKEITFEKIARYPLIFSPKQLGYKSRSFFHRQFEKRSINYRVIMEVSTIELGSKYVELGLGISVAPAGFGLDTLKKRNLSFIPIDHLMEEDEYISIILRKDKKLQSHKKAFIDLIFDNK